MKILYYLSAVLLIVYVLFLFFQVPFIDFFELKIMDLFYRIRGSVNITPDVVIVGIDEYSLTSLEAEKDVWPWSRHHYGKVVKNLFNAGAKVVVFDVSFTEEDETNPMYDNYFASIISKYKKTLFFSSKSHFFNIRTPDGF